MRGLFMRDGRLSRRRGQRTRLASGRCCGTCVALGSGEQLPYGAGNDEILARGDDPARVAVKVRAFLAAERGIDEALLERHAYVHAGPAAARHVFGVVCGLDSMILGEPQIQGQVKRAYETARRCQATGPVLDRLVQHALSAAKRTRSSTGISRHAVSVAYAAAKLARSLFEKEYQAAEAVIVTLRCDLRKHRTMRTLATVWQLRRKVEAMTAPDRGLVCQQPRLY